MSCEIVSRATRIINNPNEMTLENISKVLNMAPRTVAYEFHKNGYQNRIIDFKGSLFISKYAEFVGNFIKSRNPELHVILNRRLKTKKGEKVYFQVYICEKRTAIQIDYDIDPDTVYTKIVKLNKSDFEDIISLSKIKLLLTNKLNLNRKFLPAKQIDMLKYIDENKDLTEEQLRNKLYFKLLNKQMIRDMYELKSLEKTIRNSSLMKTNSKSGSVINGIKNRSEASEERLRNIIKFNDGIGGISN